MVDCRSRHRERRYRSRDCEGTTAVPRDCNRYFRGCAVRRMRKCATARVAEYRILGGRLDHAHRWQCIRPRRQQSSLCGNQRSAPRSPPVRANVGARCRQGRTRCDSAASRIGSRHSETWGLTPARTWLRTGTDRFRYPPSIRLVQYRLDKRPRGTPSRYRGESIPGSIYFLFQLNRKCP